MSESTAPADERALPLRERKKLRTRQHLVETALQLFLDRGFEATTLDQLVDTAEISLRTFFRLFPSKEAVALAAETELWDAYIDEIARRDLDGAVLTTLRDALSTTIYGMDTAWSQRFLATRGLAARTPALSDRSDLTSLTVQQRLVDVLETHLGIDSRDDVRLRLLGELALSAWRCGAKNWIRTAKAPDKRGHRGMTQLIRHVEDAFDAIPAAITLTPEHRIR